jgi:GNAT superfamily N-acetyltransferase
MQPAQAAAPAALRIRKARRSDAAAVAGLLGELGYPCSARDAALRLAALSRKNDLAFAAADGKRVVGLVALHFSSMLHTEGRWCRVTTLVVTESHRRRGVGEALLRHAEQCALAGGAWCVEITCGERRGEAHRFYMRHGYTERRTRFFKSLQE